MFDWIIKHLTTIADSVVNPIIQWILSLSWWARFLSLILILCVVGLIIYRESVPGWVSTSTRIYRVWKNDSKTPALTSIELESLNNAIKDLSLHLEGEFSKRSSEDPIYGSWTTGQIAIALQGKSTQVTSDNVIIFMNKQVVGDNNCWQVFRNKQCHVGNTAWVLISLASVNHKATNEQIQFILNNQKTDGWWSIYKASDNSGNASTYATAMSVLALYEHLNRNLIEQELRENVKSAINKGRAWLLKTQIPGQARWMMYPLSEDKKESISLSGLVIHVLYHLEPVPEPSLARLWLKTLPAEIPASNDFENSSHEVKITEQDWEHDEVHLYKLPWLIIGTVDAYRYGNLSEKAIALTWLESMLNNIHEYKRQSYEFPWIMSEFQISLRYLNGEDVI